MLSSLILMRPRMSETLASFVCKGEETRKNRELGMEGFRKDRCGMGEGVSESVEVICVTTIANLAK